MRRESLTRPVTPARPFRRVGGDLSLDYVNTVDWTPVGLTAERLVSYDHLVSWAQQVAGLPPEEARRLQEAAKRNAARARRALAFAHDARLTLKRLMTGVVGGSAAAEDLAAFDALLAKTTVHLTIGYLPRTVRRQAAIAKWTWRAGPTILESPVWPVVFAAARLLTSDDATRLRVCAGPDCGWLFVDRSRNGMRRWCQMSTCGTLEKSRRRARRKR